MKKQVAFDFAIPEPARSAQRSVDGRYAEVSDRKASGATYTSQEIAEYLSVQLADSVPDILERETIRVVALAKRRHDADDATTQARLEIEIDRRVWAAFGLGTSA